MNTFDCKRCGHEFLTKGNLKTHLGRKKPCEPLVADIPIQILLDDVTRKVYNEKTYNCKHCVKQFNIYTNCWRHQKTCKFGAPEDESIKIQNQTIYANISSTMEVELLNKEIQDKDSIIENLKTKILSDKRNEAYYQRLLEIYFKAGHKKIGRVGITDITTETSHIEIKKWDCWKEAIGQLFVYNNHTPRDDLQVHLFGKYEELSKKDAIKYLSIANIKCYEFQHTGDNVYIVCLQTNDIIHTFNTIDFA